MKQATPNLFIALLPLLVLIALLAANVDTFGDNTLAFSNQIALLTAAGIAGLIGLIYRVSYADMMTGVMENLKQAVPAMLVLLLIGCLAGSWLLSGVVPAMIYYGLKILSPDYFLFTACIICAVVSLATGSSWGTIATVGIALLGIGKAMDFSEGLIAGAVISGAYFGDKMSPLSDTTNLAPAVSGTDLITHIRYMTITTVPSILITLVAFFLIGLFHSPTVNAANISEVNESLHLIFNINPILFLVPIAVIAMIALRIPAVPAIAGGSVLGILFAFVFQFDLIAQLTSESAISPYALVMQTLGTNLTIQTDNTLLADLLSTGGMKGMLDTIWLIICAMVFGGVMEQSGCLSTITLSMMRLVKGRTSLIGTTAASSIIMNFTASDQYLAIVVPGKMFQKAYEDKGLHPANLSRTLEDAGTVTSVLIPWNTCGATQAGVLGVATAVYWPFCFFCLISPAMTMLVAAVGYKIKRV
jgi:Na+:H+ antiporter, NhaC family